MPKLTALQSQEYRDRLRTNNLYEKNTKSGLQRNRECRERNQSLTSINEPKESQMYDLNKICFMCLNGAICLKAVFYTDTQNDIAAQIKYILPELTIFNPEIPVYICSLCCTSLNSSYTFKKMCLENYSRLLQNTKVLQRTGDTQELQILTIKQEREENNEQEDQTTAVEDNIDIKEESVSIGNSADPEFSQQIEFVKCETMSDSEQDGGDSNNPFDKDETDNQNFAVSSCNKTSGKPDLPKQTKVQKGELKFKCLACDKQFLKRCDLKLHMKIHKVIQDFECSVCNKKFKEKSNLRMHMKIHNDIRDFECPICNKTFTQKITLKMHMKIHEGIKNFECTICNKKFILKRYLQRHMKFHEDIKDFKCLICNKMFTEKSILKLHSKFHARNKEFECSICSKKFTLKGTLQRHMQIHRAVTQSEKNQDN